MNPYFKININRGVRNSWHHGMVLENLACATKGTFEGLSVEFSKFCSMMTRIRTWHSHCLGSVQIIKCLWLVACEWLRHTSKKLFTMLSQVGTDSVFCWNLSHLEKMFWKFFLNCGFIIFLLYQTWWAWSMLVF